MNRTLVLAAAILLGPAAAHASRLYGLGTGSCASFVAQYDKQPELTAIVYYSWFQGFLSAVNLTLHSDGKPPVDYDATPDTTLAEQGFLHDYCVVHPEQQFVQASLQLIGNHQKGVMPEQSAKRP